MNMKKYDLFGYQVEIDESATGKWYENAEEWGCDCGDCRHFVSLAKKRELPEELIESLAQFGIVPEKATYVCEMLKEDGLSLYQFSYRIAGNILKERTNDKKEYGWGEVYCCHEIYPYGAPGFPTPHFDLEFWLRLSRSENLTRYKNGKKKEYKISSTLFYVSAVLFYLAALINIVGGNNTSIGIVWLCLGSTFLCLGSLFLNKSKENKKEEL